MSLERAYVNCLRCYQLAKPYINEIVGGPDNNISVRADLAEDDKIYTARNDAMKALEAVVSGFDMRESIGNISEIKMSDEAMFTRAGASQSLEACKGCIYYSPAIVDLLDSRDTE